MSRKRRVSKDFSFVDVTNRDTNIYFVNKKRRVSTSKLDIVI